MKTRTNYAPTERTIIVALVLVIVALLATYGPFLNNRVGVIAFVAADVLLLLGMVLRRL
jgi:ABC-type transporter Mla subunit MlaD